MAQQALMSTEAFEDFYFQVCTLNYARMIPGMRALERLMKKTDQVHITGPGTDLRFSIKDIGAIACGSRIENIGRFIIIKYIQYNFEMIGSRKPIPI